MCWISNTKGVESVTSILLMVLLTVSIVNWKSKFTVLQGCSCLNFTPGVIAISFTFRLSIRHQCHQRPRAELLTHIFSYQIPNFYTPHRTIDCSSYLMTIRSNEEVKTFLDS